MSPVLEQKSFYCWQEKRKIHTTVIYENVNKDRQHSTLITWKESRVVNGSRVQIVLSNIVQIPAVKAHIFLPLFEPPAVNQIPTQLEQ